MAVLGFTDVALDIHGLLGLITRFMDSASLCHLEASGAKTRGCIVHASAVPRQTAWAVALARRGLRVDLEPGCGAEEAHRELKRSCGALRDVFAQSLPEPLALGPERLKALESLLANFRESCPGWRGGKHLLDFAFNPAEVQRLDAENSPLRSVLARSRPCSGPFDESRGGVQTLHLELNCRLALQESLLVPTLFLDLCLGEPVREFTWVQVMVWGEQRDLDGGRQPELSVLRLLSSGCGNLSLGRIEEGSPLHAALSSNGTLHALVAFSPYSGVEPLKYRGPPERSHYKVQSGAGFTYSFVAAMQWLFRKLQ